MLDCEYENSRPAHITATQADQRPRAPAPRGEQRERHADAEHHMAPVEARVAEQRRDAEVVGVRVRRGEVGRVEEQLVGGRLPEPDQPRTAWRARSRRRRGARGAQSGKLARATVASSATNGSVKNSSRFVAASTSSAQRSEQHAKAKNAAAGSATCIGSGRSSRPRSARHAERGSRRREHEVERQQPAQAAVVRDLHEERAGAVERQRWPQWRRHEQRDRHDRRTLHEQRGRGAERQEGERHARPRPRRRSGGRADLRRAPTRARARRRPAAPGRRGSAAARAPAGRAPTRARHPDAASWAVSACSMACAGRYWASPRLCASAASRMPSPRPGSSSCLACRR